MQWYVCIYALTLMVLDLNILIVITLVAHQNKFPLSFNINMARPAYCSSFTYSSIYGLRLYAIDLYFGKHKHWHNLWQSYKLLLLHDGFTTYP